MLLIDLFAVVKNPYNSHSMRITFRFVQSQRIAAYKGLCTMLQISIEKAKHDRLHIMRWVLSATECGVYLVPKQ